MNVCAWKKITLSCEYLVTAFIIAPSISTTVFNSKSLEF